MMKHVYSVGQVNKYIKNMFAQDFMLHHISIKGEVSNCKYHSSGHIYFTLKDGLGAMQAVMFASRRNDKRDHVCGKPQGRIKIPDERGRPRGCDRFRGSV